MGNEITVYDVSQGTDEWIALHCGIPTASEFGMLITSKGERSRSADDFATILAADKYAGQILDRFGGNRFTDRGHELEPEARTYYELMRGPVEQVGFIAFSDGSAGCSPDGLFQHDGLTEFKCLIAKEHVKVLLYFQKNRTVPPQYVPQTQGQLYITGRKWCDLVFYHPELPKLIVRQAPRPEVFRGLREQIAAVNEERDAIVKQLISIGG